MKILLQFEGGETKQISRHLTQDEAEYIEQGTGNAWKFIGNDFFEWESGFGESATWKEVEEAE